MNLLTQLFYLAMPRSVSKITIPLAAVLLASSLSMKGSAADAVSLTTPKTGLSLHLDPNGRGYEISSADPQWTFGGGFATPLTDTTTNQGSDQVGEYQQVSFAWPAGQIPMTGWIRLYQDQPLALFSQTIGAAMDLPPAAFPAFTNLPARLHVFNYGLKAFAPPKFSANDISTPWLLFDDQANSVVISPASHFMVASMQGDGTQLVASGLNPKLRGLPAGFTQQTWVTFGKGINHTWESWGQAMLKWQGAKRPANDADITLKYLGYWTDNGASYYYNYDLSKGYAATLQELVARYRQEQIPIHYLQLDSWWYSKTTTNANATPGKLKKSEKLPEGEWNRYGGTLEYKAHPYLFPNGLAAFQKSVDLPLITHARWIDPSSPYRAKYKSSGVAMVDPQWWDDIASYLHTSGVMTYEQDWLDAIYTYSPAFSSNVDTAETFLDNMSRACAEQGINLQYCMPFPAYYMQGSRYENLTTIRACNDRFEPGKWNDFLYTSRMASALGIWPWADVFKSTERGNVLLATLSAGPVGIGDAMGSESRADLLHAVRADGVIVKPDAAIVPLDASYIADAREVAAPLLAGTYTRHGEIKTQYLFAFRRPNTSADHVNFSADDLGLSGPAYVYDYFAGTGERLDPGENFSAPMPTNGPVFYVIAPMGKSDIAFLGDANEYVGTGKQRISDLQDTADGLTVNLVFAETETAIILHGFAGAPPTVSVTNGQAGTVQYDAATKYFRVEIKPDPNAPVDKSTGDPVRQVTAIIKI